MRRNLRILAVNRILQKEMTNKKFLHDENGLEVLGK